MPDQQRSDEENRLREILKRQTEDMDRTYMRAGAVVLDDMDLLSEIWRFLDTFTSREAAGNRGGYLHNVRPS